MCVVFHCNKATIFSKMYVLILYCVYAIMFHKRKYNIHGGANGNTISSRETSKND